jgi:predicted nucleotidyltransferase
LRTSGQKEAAVLGIVLSKNQSEVRSWKLLTTAAGSGTILEMYAGRSTCIMVKCLGKTTCMTQPRIDIPAAEIADFCRKHHIRRFSLFGSVLRDDFTADSDVDVLVEFDPLHVPGLIRLGAMAEELSGILGGRRVDLLTAEDLSKHFRQDVLAGAQVEYAQS